MPQIQLDSARPGIRGAETVSVGEKAVDNGILAPIGDVLKRLPQLYVNTDLHTRMERLADTLDDNAALEAELAFDRWNAQALYGSKDNQTPTALADFEKAKDQTLRAMQLNGLMNARGMAAADGGKMYDAASQAVMNEMLGGMRPEARVKVALRLKAKREDTLRRLNARGFAQAEAAQTERQKELLKLLAATQAEEAARDASFVQEQYGREVSQANADYATAMASMPTESQFRAMYPAEGEHHSDVPDYEAYVQDYKSKATSSREGAIAAAHAKLMGGYAGVGAAYARNRAETDALSRASILKDLGLTEEQAASPEWAPVVEGKIAAAQQENGALFLESMLANGHVDFVEAALEDEASLAGAYGVRDRRIAEGLQLKIAKARSDGAKAEKRNNDSMKYWIETCNTLDPSKPGGYAITIDELMEMEKRLVAVGDYQNATLVRQKINKRQKILLDEAEAANGELAKQMAESSEISFTEENCLSILRQLQADRDIQHVEIFKGLGKDGKPKYATLSRDAMIRFLVDNYSGIEGQRDREEAYQRYAGGSPTEIEVGRTVYDVLAAGGHLGISYQGFDTDEDGNVVPNANFFRLDGGPADRGNYQLLATGQVKTVPDAIVNGELVTRNGPQTHAVMTDAQWADATNALYDAAHNHRMLHPEETQAQFKTWVTGVAGRLFGGTSLDYGDTQQERINYMIEYGDRLERQRRTLEAEMAGMINSGGYGVFGQRIGDDGKVREAQIRFPKLVLTDGEENQDKEEDKK